MDYANVIPCDARGCLSESKRKYRAGDRYLQDKRISPKKHTFENFKSVLGVGEALKVFKELATGSPTKPFILVYGITGNGKSHLCEAAATELIKRGMDVLLCPVADLMSELKEAIQSNQVEVKVRRLKETAFLFLDDYGVELGSNWEREKLEEIIGYRYRNYLVTVVTMNLDLEDIPERIRSRFSDPDMSRMIFNEAGDYRRLKKGKK